MLEKMKPAGSFLQAVMPVVWFSFFVHDGEDSDHIYLFLMRVIQTVWEDLESEDVEAMVQILISIRVEHDLLD